MKQLSPFATLLILFGCCAVFIGGALLIYKRDRSDDNKTAHSETAHSEQNLSQPNSLDRIDPPLSGLAPLAKPPASDASTAGSIVNLNSKSVGSEACGKCHPGILQSYKKHPMYYGSTRLVSDDDSPPPNSDELKGKLKTLSVKSSNGLMHHSETVYDLLGNEIFSKKHEMKYVVGSGRRAKAYLEQRDTMLCLSPLNWFGKTESWGLNPGYTIDDPRGFDRKALANCLLCHTGEIRTQSPQSDFYEPEPFGELAIGCERCHGAGEAHIAFHEQHAQGVDPIVNPESLDEPARQAVCYQCHLQPSTSRILREGRSHQDFKPGMRLDDIWLILDTDGGVDRNGRTKSVRHVQQMHDSQCFQKSGTMRCTSCHDPHSIPEPTQRIAFYRDACNNCHAPNLPQNQPNSGAMVCSESIERRNAVQDSCFECHMPRRDLDLSSHASQSDHRIPRKPDQQPTITESLVSETQFFGELADSVSEESRRRAKAIYQIRNQGPSAPLFRELRSLSEIFPNDGMTLLSYGLAAMSQNDFKTAVNAWTKATQHEESREFALEALIQVSQRNSDWARAIGFAEQLIQANPNHPSAHTQLAQSFLRSNRIDDSIKAAKQGLERDPLSLMAYQVLIEAYRARGNDEDADSFQAIRTKILEKLQQIK